MAYIDKKATIKELEKMPAYFESGDIRYGIIVAIDIVKKQAPAADVVEVVHCKNCKHLMFSNCYGECSKGYMGIVSPNDFCSNGERKDGE